MLRDYMRLSMKFLQHTSISQLCTTSGVNGVRSAKGGEVWGPGVPLPTGNTPSQPGRSLGVANFLFCELKMAYFGEF